MEQVKGHERIIVPEDGSLESLANSASGLDDNVEEENEAGRRGGRRISGGEGRGRGGQGGGGGRKVGERE